MKILRAKTSHPKKQIFKISDLIKINKNNPYPDSLPEDERDTWMSDGMNDPIEIIRHTISPTVRYGVGGKIYKEKLYSVKRGSSRVSYAMAHNYDAIEGIIVQDGWMTPKDKQKDG